MKTSQAPVRTIEKASIISFLILGFVAFSVLMHHKSVQGKGLFFNWSNRYFFFVLMPLFLYWTAQFLFLLRKPFRGHFLFRSKKFLSFLVVCSFCLVLISTVLEMNVYQARILLFIFSVLATFLLVSSLLNLKNLMLTYICFAVLGCLLFAFELPQLFEIRRNGNLIRWGESETFKFLFEKKPPFISLGGRLRPSVRSQMFSKAADSLGVRFVTNQWGFRNEETFPEKPPNNEIRILNMGDSFLIGSGIDQDQFVGPLLERHLQRTFSDRKILVMNAEVSDPAYGLYYFQNYAGRFSPKVVIYGICQNDVLQNYWFISYFNVFQFEGDQLVPGMGTQNNIPIFDKAGPNFWDKVKDITYPVPRTFVPGPSKEIKNPFQPFLKDLLKFKAIIYLKRPFSAFKVEDRFELFVREVPQIVAIENVDGRKRLID